MEESLKVTRVSTEEKDKDESKQKKIDKYGSQIKMIPQVIRTCVTEWRIW